jgi:hypothetical protein
MWWSIARRPRPWGGQDKRQSFVSLGVVQPGEPYAFDMDEASLKNQRLTFIFQ